VACRIGTVDDTTTTAGRAALSTARPALPRRESIVHRTWHKGLGGLAAALLLAAGGLAGTTSAATAAQPVTAAATSFFKIVNNRTIKCVDVPSSQHTSGVRLQEWECHGGDNQRWAPVDTGDGFFVLISKNSASLCMHIRPDLFVDQDACDIASNLQKWQWGIANSNGDLVLFSAAPGNRCLGLVPNNIGNGTPIGVIPCSNTNSANHWHPEL
jgi:hypothetical protein